MAPRRRRPTSYGYCPTCGREVGVFDGLLEVHFSHYSLGTRTSECPGSKNPPVRAPEEDIRQ